MAGSLVVGHARVSTKGADQDTSIDQQVIDLKAVGCDLVIVERASAYKGQARPEWERLLTLIASGQARRLYVASQSRLSRRGEDVQLFRMCARLGVDVQLLDGTPVDMEDPSSKLITGVVSLCNEIDSDIKSRRIKAGLAGRKAQGHYACGRVPYGYMYDGSQVRPDPETFPLARQLWEKLEAMEFNCSGARRAHGLDWSQRGLNRWLDNPMLRGVVRGEPGRVEALISWEEWQRGRQLQESRRVFQTRAPSKKRVFSSLIRCAGCNRRMHYAAAYGKPRFKCTGAQCKFWGRGLAEWKVRDQVIETLRTAAGRMTEIAAAPVQPAEPPERIAKRAQLDQLEQLQGQGVPGLEGAIDALRMDLLAPPPAPQSANWAGFRDVLLRPGTLEDASVDELRALILELVAEIIYVGDPNRVEIRLRDCPGNDPA